jgi:SPFH domain/Band 7 family protein
MFGIKFIKVQPTTYLLQYRGGKIVREGVGMSFFYYAPTTSLVAVPVGSTDTPFIFQETTGDFQTVTIQGQVTYRVGEPKRLAALLNYTLARDGETYLSEDPEKLPERVIHVINVLARAELQKLPLREAIRASDELVKAVKAGLVASAEITSLGLEVLGLSILAVKPTPETARALEAEAREKMFREADEAIYARRNSAVQQERAIKENELNTEIAVENKKRQIRETQMEAERSVQEKKHIQQKEALEANIGLENRRKNLVALSAENAKAEADARAYGVETTMKALGSADPKVLQALASTSMKPEQLIAFAFQELAGKAEKIGQLNITPDLLRELMGPQPARK